MVTPGFALIETMRVRRGRIPFLEHHLTRLEHSLTELGLRRPARDIAALVTPYSATDDAALRVEVCDGRATVTVRDVPPLTPPAVVTASEPHVPYPHKTSQRDCFVDAAQEAEIAEADDALLLTHDGWVTEGTVWNVFWWEGDGLVTPALELGVLPGIGRGRVLELVLVREGKYRREALAGRSVFFTNAVRGIVSLGSLDGEAVPADPHTAELADRFWPQP
jgi:branched-subunit amino acid aminotransferase/4-amino-4-deoxychorismate lyase